MARPRAVVARVTDSFRPRPGGRATRVVSSVLQATIEELARLGYQALRVEDVAIRASVNKTTIYRRWPTKTDLVIAALREASLDLDFIPDTGSVRGDMLALLEHSSHMNDSTAVRAFISLILAEFVAPEIARLVSVMRFEYRERWIGIVRRGMARGELPATTSAHLLAELFASVPTMRKLRNDEPLDADTREAIVDLLLAGARTTTPSTASTVAGPRNDRAVKASRTATRGDSSPTRRRTSADGAARDGRRRVAAG